MISRAGGLDQGNIILNLNDAAQHLPKDSVLYLAGSAINSCKGPDGKPNSRLGAQAMREALELWRAGDAPDAKHNFQEHVRALYAVASGKKLQALTVALEQRYGLSQLTKAGR